ncbi:MarR family transcriptional regulator [Erythrobacter sp. 3-20A1M]|uniref:MarR family winged helix-turn-helix transcriptional regulator n=1 Tax=Erythrobacter sp. 3-20A1M TaxID=2653850 RepID=UPI001BFC0BD8|nr:MarR family transcriptional regulator [Erythrobacter sp. 3-20A1M]QWC56547.1 MarR family transcriptional regulator [Erythrobacter sp. 3-20A1M]
MEFEKNLSAGYLVNHLARMFERALAERIRPLGITPGVFPALLELWAGDGLTQKDLVNRLDIEQATIANTLARMERDGLIRRERDQADGRVQRVWLTKRGRSLRDPATQAADGVNRDMLASFSCEEQQRLIELMGQLVDTAHRQRTPAGQPGAV